MDAKEITAAGRGYTKPVVTPSIDNDGVTIRVDCERRPELWMEVRIPHAALRNLYKTAACFDDTRCEPEEMKYENE